MKKYLVLICALLALTSCGRDKGIDAVLLEKADEYFEMPTVPDEDEFMGDYAPETEYSSGDLSAVSGICYTAGQNYYAAIADGKYFFDVNTFQTIQNDDGSTSRGTTTTIRNMNLENGESFYVCPDPLCSHIGNVCEYTDLGCIGYYGGSLYCLRHTYGDGGMTFSIEKLDPVSGVFTVLLEQYHGFDDNPSIFLIPSCIVKNDLYYTLQTVHEDPEKRTRTESSEKFRMNLDTMEITAIPADAPSIHYISETAAYGYSSELDAIVRTDLNYENSVTIMPPEGYPLFGDMQADENTGEVFVLMLEPERRYGVVCRITDDTMEQIALPHEQITEFQITRDKIYYTAYDPVELGPGRHDTILTLDNGGKIYATDRTNHDTAELIFADGVDFIMHGWFVLGDNLYIDTTVLLEEAGEYSFGLSRSLKHVRINLVNHTARYFRFD